MGRVSRFGLTRIDGLGHARCAPNEHSYRFLTKSDRRARFMCPKRKASSRRSGTHGFGSHWHLHYLSLRCHVHSRAGEANTDGALLVGAVDARSVVFEHLHGFGAGVSVLVVGSYADECDLGGKLRELFACQATLAAVVGDFEKVDIAYLRYDALQRLAFGIACEQPRASALPSPSSSNSSNPTRLSSFSLVPPSCGAMMLRENRPARKVVPGRTPSASRPFVTQRADSRTFSIKGWPAKSACTYT